jgi:hypothetical protein
MIAIQNFRHPEFRERLTQVILEMLAQLPETHRNIFVWNHYRGYHPEHIAQMVGWSSAEVEGTLGEINLMLCRTTRALLAEDPQADEKEVDLRVSRHRRTTAFFVSFINAVCQRSHHSSCGAL